MDRSNYLYGWMLSVDLVSRNKSLIIHCRHTFMAKMLAWH